MIQAFHVVRLTKRHEATSSREEVKPVALSKFIAFPIVELRLAEGIS